MESPQHSLDYQQAFRAEPNFDKYAQQMLENGKIATTAATISTSSSASSAKISDFLQEFGATFINSIQLQNFQKILNSAGANRNASATAHALIANSSLSGKLPTTSAMEIEFVPNQIIIDSSSFESMDTLQKQLEYDKFMNEVWIGIVLTLILISMIFCICSCFLYHQFRTWKQNYHSTLVQANASDIESMKLEADLDDPVPEYTLVSGLPSYEAAVELLQKTPKSCLIVYPSVFSVFNKNEKLSTNGTTATTNTDANITISTSTTTANQQQNHHIIDITTPLLSNNNNNTTNSSTSKTNSQASLPTYLEALDNGCCSTITPTATPTSEKELLEFLHESVTTSIAEKSHDEVKTKKGEKK